MSRTITEEDLRNILNEVLPPSNERIFHIENISGSGRINASTSGSIPITLPTVSGYVPIGIIGVTNSHGAHFCITDFSLLSATSARVVCRNVSNTAQTITITAKVLYVLNGMSN